jgi:hypothetical protein
MDDFFSLSRYSLDDVDTDAKRRDKFLAGLKGELKIPLSVAYAPNYQALLDQAGNGGNFNGHKHNGGFRGNNGHHNGNNGHHNGGNGQRRFNSDAKKNLSHITCYKCKKTGHYSNTCP